jgi:hypothetical protein
MYFYLTKISQTHNVAMASPISDFVVSLGTDGRILSQGSVTDALKKDSHLAEDIKKEEQAIEADAAVEDLDVDSDEVATTDKSATGKLIVEEEVRVNQQHATNFLSIEA